MTYYKCIFKANLKQKMIEKNTICITFLKSVNSSTQFSAEQGHVPIGVYQTFTRDVKYSILMDPRKTEAGKQQGSFSCDTDKKYSYDCSAEVLKS